MKNLIIKGILALIVLAYIPVSTSAQIIRNTPKIPRNKKLPDQAKPKIPNDVLNVHNHNINGVYSDSDGGFYYITQIGNKVYWLSERSDRWTTVFSGIMIGDRVEGKYWTLPKGKNRANLIRTSGNPETLFNGTLIFDVINDGRIFNLVTRGSDHSHIWPEYWRKSVRPTGAHLRARDLSNVNASNRLPEPSATGVWQSQNGGYYYARETRDQFILYGEKVQSGSADFSYLFFGEMEPATPAGEFGERWQKKAKGTFIRLPKSSRGAGESGNMEFTIEMAGKSGSMTSIANGRNMEYKKVLSRDITAQINRLVATSSDACGHMDFKAIINISTDRGRYSQVMEGNDIRPNWSSSKSIFYSYRSKYQTVEFIVMDDDEFGCGGGDDKVDVSPESSVFPLKVNVYPDGNIYLQKANGTIGKHLGRTGQNITVEGDALTTRSPIPVANKHHEESARMIFRIDMNE